MKQSRWWMVSVVAASIAWMLWWSQARTAALDSNSAVQPESAADAAAPVAAVDTPDSRDVVRAAGEETLDAASRRNVHLELLRFPDEAPLVEVQVEIAPILSASASNWLITDAAGHVDIDVLAGTTKLDVQAAGYEPRELELERSAASVRVLVAPVSGLFGRVVDGEHAPVAGADVRLDVSRRTVQNARRATRSNSGVGMADQSVIAATATTTATGFYYLAYSTTMNVEKVRVVATAGDAAGALEVGLPRATTSLDDLAVSHQRSLTIRIVDTSGAPVAGATVWGNATPRQSPELRTGSDGLIALRVPALPATFVASAAGMRQREQRFDGRVVPRGMQVESFETRVELVLETVPSVRARVLDAETRQSIFLFHGRIEFVSHGEVTGRGSFEADSRGETTVVLVDEGGRGDGENKFDVARLSVTANDFLPGEPTDIDMNAPLGREPIEFLLQPLPGTVTLHGRVLRAGEPVAGVQVGVKVQTRSEGAKPRGWEYKRAFTDADGRFTARWPRKSDDQVVSAFPHWFRWDEFGFIGPLDVDVAVASEQVLELKPAIRVPAILRGVSKGGRYLYFVSVVDGDVAINTTINGAPLAVDVDGEARVTLLLPGGRRSRVSVGYSTGSSYNDNAANAIEFDPAQHTTLVFDLQPLFATISGRAVSFTTDEIARLSVTFIATNDQQSRTVRCNADGTFRIGSVPRGTGDLLLLLDGAAPYQANVLARMPLVLQGDVENLQLTRDAASPPETAPESR